MKNLMKKSAVAAVALTAMGGQQAVADTTTVDMVAEVVAPVVIAVATDMNFGSLTVAAGSGGNLIIDNTGDRSASTGGVTPITGAAAETQGVVNLSGAKGVNIVLSIGVTTALVNGTAQTMAFATTATSNNEDITVEGAAIGVVTIPTADTDSQIALNVGATVVVSAGQAEGTYNGDFQLIANYQ